MRILIACIGAFLLAVLFRNAIKKAPWLWYAASILAVAAYFLLPASLAMHGDGAAALFTKAMQRGTFGFALLVVVMFVGVWGQVSTLRRWLGPIRRQLSIMGCLLMVPHVAFYAPAYLKSMALFDAGRVSLSLAVALVVTVLGVVLFVTSFLAVKRRMPGAAWRRIQALSYVFFGLAFVHSILFLAPSAFAGRMESVVNVGAYGVIACLYLVLRLRRRYCDLSNDSLK